MKIHLPSPTKLMGGSMIGYPMQGCTQTFITLGAFDTEQEAINAQKYIKTKFARAMLSLKKVSQHSASRSGRLSSVGWKIWTRRLSLRKKKTWSGR